LRFLALTAILSVGIFITVACMGVQKTGLFKETEKENDPATTKIQQEEDLLDDDEPDLSVEDPQESEVQANVAESQEPTRSAMIEGVPHIQQMPELARGCEVTSLAMMLQYAGVSADKMTLAKEIKTIPFRDKNGVRGNPYDGFVGDIYTFKKSGLGVYHGPIADLAQNYLPDRIVDLTGENMESVYEMLEKGSPVWVIINSRFTPLPESEFAIWNTASGKVKITYREHSVLIVGYDEQKIYFNDPLASQPYTAVPRDNFEKAWIQMGSQAISYK